MFRFKTFINESYYKEYLNKLFKLLETKYTDSDISVHFSNHPTVGLNPNPTHSDPFGVYSFPREYILELNRTQYFFNFKNQFIIKPSRYAKILNLDMTPQKAASLLTIMGVPPHYLSDSGTYHHSGHTIGHKFWGALERFRKENNLKKTFWNTLFKKTEYNVLYDPGLKIIHEQEPTQYIFLTKNSYEVIDHIQRNTNYGGILERFIKEFYNYNYKIVKKGKHGSFTLSQPDKISEISIQFDNAVEGPPNMQIRIYGLQEGFSERISNYTFGNRKSHLDLDDVIKNMKLHIRRYGPSQNSYNHHLDRNMRDYMLEQFCDTFNFKKPKNKDGEFIKIYPDYIDGVKLKLNVSFWKDNIFLGIYRNGGWGSSLNYSYYSRIAVDVNKGDLDYRLIMSELFNDIKTSLMLDKDDDEYWKSSNAIDGLKHIEFLKKNVFKLRN